MATHSKLFEQEQTVIEAQATLTDLITEYERECAYECNPHAYPANHDVWGTIRLNVLTLHNLCEEFLTTTAKEFSPDKIHA